MLNYSIVLRIKNSRAIPISCQEVQHLTHHSPISFTVSNTVCMCAVVEPFEFILVVSMNIHHSTLILSVPL